MIGRYRVSRVASAASAWAVFLVCLLFSACFACAGSIRVTPSRIEKDITRLFWIYNNRFGPIYVTNCGSESVKVRVYAGSIGQDAEGGALFIEEGDSFSIADKIVLEPAEFLLEPGAAREVNGKIEVEKGRRGGGYAALFFEAAPVWGRPESVVVASRIGVLLFASYPGERRISGEIVKVELLRRKEEGGYDLAVAYRNTGDIHIRPAGRVILTPMASSGRLDTKRRIIIDAGGESILPGFERILRIPLEGITLRKGERLLLELTLSLGQRGGRTDYIKAEMAEDPDGGLRLDNVTRPLEAEKK